MAAFSTGRRFPVAATLLLLGSMLACSSYVSLVPSPGAGQSEVFKEGYKVIVYEDADVKIGSCANRAAFEKGENIQVFFAVLNKTQSPITISSADVTAQVGGLPLKIYSQEEVQQLIVKKRKSEETSAGIEAGLGAVAGVLGVAALASGSGSGGSGLVVGAVAGVDADSSNAQSKEKATRKLQELSGYLRTTIEPGQWGSGYVEMPFPKGVETGTSPLLVEAHLGGGEKVTFQFQVEKIN